MCEQGVAPYVAQSAPKVNFNVGSKINMRRTIIFLMPLLGAFIFSGCSTTPDLYLKDEVSGRIYGPLDTSKITDRHIPEGRYMALYPTEISMPAITSTPIEFSKTVLLRHPDTTNDIPQSEWNSLEKTLLLSPDMKRFSEQGSGTIMWGEENGQEWAFQLLETTVDRVIIIRLGSTFSPPIMITSEDIETHKVLTETIVDRLELREAPLEAVIDLIRPFIPIVHNEPIVVIKLDISAQEISRPITLNLSHISLMDAIEYVAEVTGCSYSISGNVVRLKEQVQQSVPGYRHQEVSQPDP
jgi:hypothetical protein